METEIDPCSGYCRANGIFYSMRKPSHIPGDAPMDAATFVLRRQYDARTALVDAATGFRVTYAQLRQSAAAVAGGLHRLGVRLGDVVLVVSSNSLQFPAIAMGVLSAGAVLSTANPLFTAAELRKQMDDSRPALVFTTPDLLTKFAGVDVRTVVIEPENGNYSVGCSFPDTGSENPDVGIRREDPALLMYSSGTTGKNKGVVSTHGNVIAMTSILCTMIDSCNDIYLCVLPLFHMYGFTFLLCGVLAVGGTVVVSSQFTVEKMLAAIDKYRITHIPTVPTVVTRLCKSPDIARRYDLSSLKSVMVSGAAMGRNQMVAFRSLFSHVAILQLYGLTETSGPTMWSEGNDIRHYGSAGTLMPNMEAKIVDLGSGKPLPPNRSGELCLRGPVVMKGYFMNEEATKSAIDSGGWFHTGDVCYINQEGRIFVVDRIKELIKYKGFQVAPVELEELLLSHSEIEDCAVIPYPDEDAGEIPLAFVVKKVENNLTAGDVIDFIRKKVAPYKKIRRVAFVESIPRSPLGKILRNHLKIQLQQPGMISRL